MKTVELLVTKAEVKVELEERINEGEHILDTNYIDMDESSLEDMRHGRDIWNDYNVEYLKRIFSDDSIANEYERDLGGVITAGASLERKRGYTDRTIKEKITRLKSIISRLPLIPVKQTLKEKPTRQLKKDHKEKTIVKKENNSSSKSLLERYWWVIGAPLILFILEKVISKIFGF